MMYCALYPIWSVRTGCNCRVNLQVIHAMVLQFVLVRPFLGYVISIMWIDASFGDTAVRFESSLSTVLSH
jgi:hypothetical protein